MFTVVSEAGNFFYTGKSGEDFVSQNPSYAFEYTSRGEAQRRADSLNKFSPLHKIVFRVEEHQK